MTIIPWICSEGPNPFNKSTTGEFPTKDEGFVACIVVEVDANPDNALTDVSVPWPKDKPSRAGKLLGAGAVPIDNRSNRASVPLFWVWFVPKIWYMVKL